MGHFIRTRLATGWEDEPDSPRRLLDRVRRRPPHGDGRLHLVDSWLLEFPDQDPARPWREIGVDREGAPVFAAPTEDDYGFWLDTNMSRPDFSDAEEIPEALFASLWARYLAEHPDLRPID